MILVRGRGGTAQEEDAEGDGSEKEAKREPRASDAAASLGEPAAREADEAPPGDEIRVVHSVLFRLGWARGLKLPGRGGDAITVRPVSQAA